MIIGRFRMEKLCESRGLQMCEAVYGEDHVKCYHEGKYYKMRYLKSIDC